MKYLLLLMISFGLIQPIFPGQGSQNKAGNLLRIRVSHAINLSKYILENSTHPSLNVVESTSGKTYRELWIREIDSPIEFVADSYCYLPKDEALSILEDRCHSEAEVKMLPTELRSSLVNAMARTSSESMSTIYLYENALLNAGMDQVEAVLLVMHEAAHHIGFGVSNTIDNFDDLKNEITYAIVQEEFSKSDNVFYQRSTEIGILSRIPGFSFTFKIPMKPIELRSDALLDDKGNILKKQKTEIFFTDTAFDIGIKDPWEYFILRQKYLNQSICKIGIDFGYLMHGTLELVKSFELKPKVSLEFILDEAYYFASKDRSGQSTDGFVNDPKKDLMVQKHIARKAGVEKLRPGKRNSFTIIAESTGKYKGLNLSCDFFTDEPLPTNLTPNEAMYLLKQELKKQSAYIELH
jgi:hypothetical protein